MRITIVRMDETDYGADALIEIEGDGYKLEVAISDGASRTISVRDALGKRFLLPYGTPYDAAPSVIR